MMYRTLAATAAIALLGVSAASAETYTVREAQSRFVACYDRVYVPATIEVNTRGELVRAESEEWQTRATEWNRVRNPSVFIQTRRVVEEDHFTLVRKNCPR